LQGREEVRNDHARAVRGGRGIEAHLEQTVASVPDLVGHADHLQVHDELCCCFLLFLLFLLLLLLFFFLLFLLCLPFSRLPAAFPLLVSPLPS
jgi:hypothetical protein